jgi:hypothetical protein
MIIVAVPISALGNRELLQPGNLVLGQVLPPSQPVIGASIRG